MHPPLIMAKTASYFAILDPHKSPGVANKIEQTMDALRDLEFETKVIYTPTTATCRHFSFARSLAANSSDLFIIRNTVYSMFLLTEAAATALLSPSERRELRFKKGISSAPGDEHFDLSRLPRPTKGSSPTLARSVSGASAAAAVPATASPSGADRSGSVTVRVLFRRAGALGLDFTIDGNQSVVVDRIAPGSVAAAEPRLSEGLRLVEVQGRRTHHMEAKDALDILKRYAADRPLALAFAAE